MLSRLDVLKVTILRSQLCLLKGAVNVMSLFPGTSLPLLVALAGGCRGRRSLRGEAQALFNLLLSVHNDP